MIEQECLLRVFSYSYCAETMAQAVVSFLCRRGQMVLWGSEFIMTKVLTRETPALLSGRKR